ncbi:hypothetical protein [Vibrio sp. 1180_3]|uniref:hypothetical protein n=1 Tax=Vibrio sp. 1180_3 TaxID=2528832 RepID=UPI002405865F|nr:hypothetical protein [Vibrio sp. 1180_3]MDF9399131.1 hypothetical protein [Vibrio sp. 1180_3]
MMIITTPALAQVFAPDPNTKTPEVAFNDVIGSGSWQNLAFLIKGVAAAISLIFTAWALAGIYDAALVKSQITNKEAVILSARLLTIITAFIVLLSL